MSDFDLSGTNWKAIVAFSGTIEGNGHVISNLTCQAGKDDAAAFIDSLWGATVKDFSIENASITRSKDNTDLEAGILAKCAYNGKGRSTVIQNCSTSGTITSNVSAGGYGLGGILGSAKGSTQLIGCSSSADVISTDPSSSDMIGGIVGQWEKASDSALIDSCYFTGSISTACNQDPVGGILGAGVSFNDNTVLIKNCFCIPKKFKTPAPENALYIGALDNDGNAANCFWPEGDAYDAVVRLVVDWNTGNATADPNFDQSVCGTAVSDFSQPSVLQALNDAAPEGVTWEMGKDGYPVFSRQENLIGADYSKIDELLKQKPNDLSLYTAASVKQLEATEQAIDRSLNKLQQTTVNSYAEALEQALAGLEKLADYSAVDEALEGVPQDMGVYTADSVATLEQAVGAVIRGKGASEQAEVNGYAAAIEQAIAQLVYRDADYSAIDAILQKIPADLSGYTTESVRALKAAMGAIVRGKNITEQETVDGYAAKLEQALNGLEKKKADDKKPDQEEGKPETDAKPGEPLPQDRTDADVKSDNLLPQTGDDTILTIVCIGALGSVLACAGAVGIRRNRN